jgi:hypothetical protein
MSRTHAAVCAALAVAFAGVLTAQSDTMSVDEVRPGMVGVGRTVFEGDRLEEFEVHILGVLRNVIGTRRDLVLARLEGGPLAETGVIAGMSGSPVYIDGRLLGAVSYSLGAFSTEPIAGITPIGEMRDAAAIDAPRARAAQVALELPVTVDGLRASLDDAFAWLRPFASNAADVRVLGGDAITPAMATLLRPIGTPLTFAGFDPSTIDPLVPAFRDQGFVPSPGLAAAQAPFASAATPEAAGPLRPGDAVGVALMTGDLEFGATGTVTAVDGDEVFAFGHPFYNLGPTRFPMTRAWVHTVLPSLANSSKLASLGEVIGTMSQDRATAVAGTLGPGPQMIPLALTLRSDRNETRTFEMQIAQDQLMTPLLAYLAVLNTLGSYERAAGAASFEVRGTADIQGQEPLTFDNFFSGDQASTGAAAAVVGPVNFLLRNAFEDVAITAMRLEIDAREEPREATIERVWVDTPTPRPGQTVTVHTLLRTWRGDEAVTSLPIAIPASARGTVSIMVADARELSLWEMQEFQTEPLGARSLPRMIASLNEARRNDRLYVRLLSTGDGAVVRGEALTGLPPSVSAVLDADRGAGVRRLRTAPLGEWDVPLDQAVTGARTLTLTLDE